MAEEKLSFDSFRENLSMGLWMRGWRVMDIVGGNHVFQAADGMKITVDMPMEYQNYLQGKSLEQLVDNIVAPSKAEKASESGISMDRIYPYVKDDWYIENTIKILEMVKKKEGADLTVQDQPLVLKFGDRWSFSILLGYDNGPVIEYISGNRLAKLGLNEQQLFDRALLNLEKKIAEFVDNDAIKIVRQAEGAYSVLVPDDFAGAMLIIANKYYDYFIEKTGMTDAGFLYCFPVSNTEFLIGSPNIGQDMANLVVDKVLERQNKIPKPLRIAPFLIKREGLVFSPD